MAEGIKVAVRVRPFSPREIEAQCSCIVSADGPVVSVRDAASSVQAYTFDRCYWSHDRTSAKYASQETIMGEIGDRIIGNALNGFNGCLFAYGATGSGKSYSMLGYINAPGVIPLAIERLFIDKHTLEARPDQELRCWISFLEIYNESVYDLLHVGHERCELTILDHPRLGTIIPNSAEVLTSSAEEVQRLMDYGTKRRALAATQLNDASSRSHAAFCMRLERLEGHRPRRGQPDKRRPLHSQVHLLDLAGSERAQHRTRLPESRSGMSSSSRQGMAINMGLVNLGRVVQQLVDNSAALSPRSATISATDATTKVPFHLSKLTYLLRGCLAGNFKTYMLATISPADSSRYATISTLEFGSVVRGLKTVPVQNWGRKTGKFSSALEMWIRKELDIMRTTQELSFEPRGRDVDLEDYMPQYREDSMDAIQLREQVLIDCALVQDPMPQSTTPYLLNMSDDPTLAGCLTYYLLPGQVHIGRSAANTISLSGIGISDRLCTIENRDDSIVTIRKTSTEGRVVVSGQRLEEGQAFQLQHGHRLFLGRAFAFKVGIPNGALHFGEPESLEFDLVLDGLEDEWTAIEDSLSWRNLSDYLEQVVCHLLPNQAVALCEEVKSGVKVCEEANDITDELRPHEGLHFEVDLTSAVPASVVIRVLKMTGDSCAEGDHDALYLWSVAQLQERVDRMRDEYHSFIAKGHCSENPICDPWHEVHPHVVMLGALELQTSLEASSRTLGQLEAWRERTVGKYTCFFDALRHDSLKRHTFLSWYHCCFSSKQRRNLGSPSRRASPGSARAKSGAGMRSSSAKGSKAHPEVPKLVDMPSNGEPLRRSQARTPIRQGSRRKGSMSPHTADAKAVRLTADRLSAQEARLAEAAAAAKAAEEMQMFQELGSPIVGPGQASAVSLPGAWSLEATGEDWQRPADIGKDAQETIGELVSEFLRDSATVESSALQNATGNEREAALSQQLDQAWSLCNVLTKQLSDYQVVDHASAPPVALTPQISRTPGNSYNLAVPSQSTYVTSYPQYPQQLSVRVDDASARYLPAANQSPSPRVSPMRTRLSSQMLVAPPSPKSGRLLSSVSSARALGNSVALSPAIAPPVIAPAPLSTRATMPASIIGTHTIGAVNSASVECPSASVPPAASPNALWQQSRISAGSERKTIGAIRTGLPSRSPPPISRAVSMTEVAAPRASPQLSEVAAPRASPQRSTSPVISRPAASPRVSVTVPSRPAAPYAFGSPAAPGGSGMLRMSSTTLASHTTPAGAPLQWLPYR